MTHSTLSLSHLVYADFGSSRSSRSNSTILSITPRCANMQMTRLEPAPCPALSANHITHFSPCLCHYFSLSLCLMHDADAHSSRRWLLHHRSIRSLPSSIL